MKIFSGLGIKEGDLVILDEDEDLVKKEFAKVKAQWNDKMKGMLGQRYIVISINSSNNTIALPSPDGSLIRYGRCDFPKTVVKKEGKKFYYYL